MTAVKAAAMWIDNNVSFNLHTHETEGCIYKVEETLISFKLGIFPIGSAVLWMVVTYFELSIAYDLSFYVTSIENDSQSH